MKLFLLLLFILDWLLLTVLALQPASGAPGPLHADKVMHFIAYLQLTGFAYIITPHMRYFHGMCAVIVLYGLGIEIIQGFLPTREASVGDFLANTLGVLMAVVLVRWIEAKRALRAGQG